MGLISKAVHSLESHVLKTPTEHSPFLSEMVGAPVYLKLESLQVTGSFKIRGALFHLLTLSEAEKERGVVTCSAGNHGLGLAYGAKKLGIPCTVYIPKNIDEAKRDKIKKLGARVRQSNFIGYDDTLSWAYEEIAKTNQHFISAFEDERIMAGNGGTIANELYEDFPSIKNIIFPIGGGGLGSGLSYYFKEVNPSIRLIGCQHVDSPGFRLSLVKDEAITKLPSIETLAGGVEGGIGIKCFEVLKHRIDEVCLVSEEEIYDAFCWMLEYHQYLIEPTAAVSIAAVLSGKVPFLEGMSVILLSGRNVSLSTTQRILQKRYSFFQRKE